MFRKAIEDLTGHAVVARHGRLGEVDDVYFERGHWQVRYLLLEAAGKPLLLCSDCVVGTVARRNPLFATLSRAQVEDRADAWSQRPAAPWLEAQRLHSGRAMVGMRAQAQDGAAGFVADLLVDDEHWAVEYVLIRAQPAARGAPLLVPLDWVGALDQTSRVLSVLRTRRELARSPTLGEP